MLGSSGDRLRLGNKEISNVVHKMGLPDEVKNVAQVRSTPSLHRCVYAHMQRACLLDVADAHSRCRLDGGQSGARGKTISSRTQQLCSTQVS